MRVLFLAALALCLFGLAPAQAHRAHAYRAHVHHHVAQDEASQHRHYAARSIGRKSVSGRPRDCYGIPWCGCWMRHVMGVADRSYDLARSWAHWGRLAAAQVGAVVVWRHHVGRIVGEANGRWLVQSGNDGHAVRTRPRSLAGVIAIRI